VNRPLVVTDGIVEQLKRPLNLGSPKSIESVAGGITVSAAVHSIDNVIGSSRIYDIYGGEEGDLVIIFNESATNVEFRSGGNIFIPGKWRLSGLHSSATFYYGPFGWQGVSHVD
jgi:hypothetical protein